LRLVTRQLKNLRRTYLVKPERENCENRQSTLIAALQKDRAYTHPVSSIEVIETHISWVILTGEFAYKIKKAVRLDFLDFSTLDRREHFCREELRLNQKWAPQLYLDVMPICGTCENPLLGGDGVPIEYALKMRQFPQSAQLDNQLAAGLLREKDLYRLAETVADYHRTATTIEYTNDRESVGKVRAPMLENFAPLKQTIDMDLLNRVQVWTTDSLVELKPALIERRKDGFVRECHGDLHLSNLVRLEEGIVAFDCVEFSAELRNIDVVSDIAFLVMDLVGAARQDLAYVFLNRYLECTGDYPGMTLFGLYFVYHSMIRAKVAAIRSAERLDDDERQTDIEKLKHNLAVAARWIDSPNPMLIAMHGYSGSGKTWLSSQLLSQLPAIRVRSDIERKRFFGLDELAVSASRPGEGIYTDASNKNVYKKLLQKCERLLEAGFNVIVDASFLGHGNRQLFKNLADRRGVSYSLVAVNASRKELDKRLQERSTRGKDASEAGIDVLRHQYENADVLTAAERRQAVFVATDEAVDLRNVIRQIKRA